MLVVIYPDPIFPIFLVDTITTDPLEPATGCKLNIPIEYAMSSFEWEFGKQAGTSDGNGLAPAPLIAHVNFPRD